MRKIKKVEIKAENCLKCAYGKESEGKIEGVQSRCILKDCNISTIYEKDKDGKNRWFCKTFITPEEKKKEYNKRKKRGY